jgi:hypothetical protein
MYLGVETPGLDGCARRCVRGRSDLRRVGGLVWRGAQHPFNLSWQRAQSVDLRQAVVLQGYVFDYARAFWPLEPFSIAIAIAALFGIRRVLDDRRCTVAVAVSASALMFASGTKGPFGLPYTWLVLHVPEIGVYRELYDLVGVVAIGYMVLLATGIGAWRPGAALLLAATCSYAFPWITRPPATFSSMSHIYRARNSPLFRTLVSRSSPHFSRLRPGRGSGVDPDAYGRAGFASPINEVFPAFPVDSALGFMTFRHDDRYLKALSVAKVIPRPYLQTNFKTLRFQWIAMNGQIGAARYRALDGLSMLTILASDPGLATIANRPDEAAIFFGDAVSKSSDVSRPIRASTTRAWLGRCPACRTDASGMGHRVRRRGNSKRRSAPAKFAGRRNVVAGADQPADRRRAWPNHSASQLGPALVAARCRRTRDSMFWHLHRGIASEDSGASAGASPDGRGACRPRRLHNAMARRRHASSGHERNAAIERAVCRRLAGVRRGRPLPHLRLDTALNAWKFAKVPVGGGTTVTFVESIAALQLALEVLVAAAIAALATFEGLRAYRSA